MITPQLRTTMGIAPLIAAAVALILVGCSTSGNEDVAITNVTVIDAVNGLRPNQTVVFSGDRIISTNPSSVSSDASTVIDGTGKFLIPGLWDMHVHLTYEPRLIDQMPGMFLNYGITSVRDTGGLLDKLLPVVDSMRAPGAHAPRVFFSGPLMDGADVVYSGEAVPEIGLQNADRESAIANVANLKQSGVDFIKIYEMVTPDVFATISEEARKHNLPVAAHVPLSMLASAVAPSVSSLEHLRNIELDCSADAEELLLARNEALKNEADLRGITLRGNLHRLQRNVAIESLDLERCRQVIASMKDVIQVPTAGLNTLTIRPPWENEDWPAAVQSMPVEIQPDWQSPPSWYQADASQRDTLFADYVLEMIRSMHEAGVPIGAGTDTPIARAIPGYSLHWELEVLVRAGLSPLDAIEAATISPARFFDLDDEMGSIAANMRADMILLDSNPLDNIRNTRDISTVIYRGNVLEP